MAIKPVWKRNKRKKKRKIKKEVKETMINNISKEHRSKAAKELNIIYVTERYS